MRNSVNSDLQTVGRGGEGVHNLYSESHWTPVPLTVQRWTLDQNTKKTVWVQAGYHGDEVICDVILL